MNSKKSIINKHDFNLKINTLLILSLILKPIYLFIFLFHNLSFSMHSIQHSLYNCVVKENNQNLDERQKLSLKIHWQLGHQVLQYIKWIINWGIFGKFAKWIIKILINNCPKYATYIYTKQTTITITITKKLLKQNQENHNLNTKKLQPGDMIATD